MKILLHDIGRRHFLAFSTGLDTTMILIANPNNPLNWSSLPGPIFQEKLSAMMKLLKLVKERRDELPQDDEDYGRAILRLIGGEIEVCHFLS